MTISGDTICSVIQAFPVLLILAQNANRCLKTPLIYHPPHPTHSPEYYEALDALFQTLYGHGSDHSHGHDDHGCDNSHGYQYHGDYGYGKKSVHKYYYNHKPCHHKPQYGHTGSGYGQPGYGYGESGHGYGGGHTGHGYGYPTYVLKAKKPPGHGHDGTKVYAPNQVYNVKHKSKIVVRKNKHRKQKSAAITEKDESCKPIGNEAGSCILLKQCQPYLKLFKEDKKNATRRVQSANCGYRGNDPKVCCPLSALSLSPSPEPSSGAEASSRGAAVSLPEPPVCGVSKVNLGRVVDGTPAKLGMFPWMALLGYKTRIGHAWSCGGSLISSRHVLTAAHCIHEREKTLYVVRLGELDYTRDDDGAYPVDVLIKSMVKHQEYNRKLNVNDIGVLVLDRTVDFTDLIHPICIPRSQELRSMSFEAYRPFVAGWGNVKFRAPSSPQLLVAELPVVKNERCEQAYAAFKDQATIDKRVLCAGYEGKGACAGDSGGPLMQPVRNTTTGTTVFYAIGIFSYGKKCANVSFPGVYPRVTSYVSWIEDTVTNY